VDDSSIELVRDVARVANGPASYFYAPMIVPDATTATALRRQPEVARAIERFASVTKAVVGVGGWDPPASTVHDAISPAERRALHRLGVLADVSGVFLDAEGNAVQAPLTERIIGIRAAQLHRVPEVIAIAYGPEKAAATRAAICGGYVTGLVTHSSFARSLLPTG
jgi:DNA-binding transcriptional regulator LsrR (DeoR family)